MDEVSVIPDGPVPRLLWAAGQIRSGRSYAEVAPELGGDVSDLTRAFRRFGIDPWSANGGVGDELVSLRPVEHDEPVASQRSAFARLQEPSCALLLGEVCAAVEMELEGSKHVVYGAIGLLAKAKGRADTRQALVRLAGACLRWANAIGESTRDGARHHADREAA